MRHPRRPSRKSRGGLKVSSGEAVAVGATFTVIFVGLLGTKAGVRSKASYVLLGVYWLSVMFTGHIWHVL